MADQPSTKVHDEQVKAKASFLNIVAAGCMNAGVIAPTVALTLLFPDISAVKAAVMGGLAVLWFAVGVLLHSMAVSLLKGLRP